MEAATKTQKQEFVFQAEIKQLLHLLAHSLYQSKEIAVRELISNASDALDKMRYVALTDESQRDEAPLEIECEGRKDTHELVIRDNGVGMTHEELVTNLGTIAHSGSVEFLKAMAAGGPSKSEVSLIGQFGVGFYSAFMIADRVRVRTRSSREESGWEWESEGSGSFTVTPVDGPLPRGTEVILHLKDDAKDFGSPWRIKEIVRRYSSFVAYPIRLGQGGLGGRDREAPGPFRLPLPAELLLVTPRPDLDPLGDHEGRVEPDAELADEREVGLGARVAAQRLEELARAAVRDRSQVRDQLVVRHAEARVADDQPPRGFIGLDHDLQRARVAPGFVGQRHVAHLVERVGGVGDQLADRDLAALVERVRQQVKELLDLGLEREFLPIGRGCHRRKTCHGAVPSRGTVI